MNMLTQLREKRNRLWNETKEFLAQHRDENGMVPAEYLEVYDKMASDVKKLGEEIKRLEDQAVIDRIIDAQANNSKKMDELVNDSPETNMEVMMNLAFVKDKEVWIRGGSETGEDCTLVEFQKQMCKRCEYCKNVNIDTENLDAITDYYLDCSMDGCQIGTTYFIAVQAAELRERLREYESKSDSVAPVVRINVNRFKYSTCGNCGAELCTGKPKFCCECGQAVKWNA